MQRTLPLGNRRSGGKPHVHRIPHSPIFPNKKGVHKFINSLPRKCRSTLLDLAPPGGTLSTIPGQSLLLASHTTMLLSQEARLQMVCGRDVKRLKFTLLT